MHQSKALTNDEIDRALRRCDRDGLLALDPRKMKRQTPPRGPWGPRITDVAIFLAASFLLVAGFYVIERFGAARLATSRCLPSIEICR